MVQGNLEDHQPAVTFVGLTALAIFLSALCLRSFMTESHWLDETISVWIARAEPNIVINRAIEYQGQSPLYYLLLSAWGTLFGWGEAALRMLSLLFLATTAAVTMKLAQRFSVGPYAPLAVLLLFSIDPVVISLSARPYAMALFCTTLSLYWVLEIERAPRGVAFVGYALSMTAAGYSHYLFLLAGIPQLILILQFPQRSRTLALGSMVFVGLAMLPMVPQLLSLWRRAPDLSFAETPTPFELLMSLLPPYVGLYMGIGLALGYLWSRGTTFQWEALRGGSYGRLCTLIFLVPLLVGSIAWLGGPALTVERYFLWVYPFVALGMAGMLRVLSTPRARIIALLAITLFATGREFGRRWQVEEWREAAHVLEEGGATLPLVAYTGLIESRIAGYLDEVRHHEYLVAPLRVYGVQGPVIPVSPRPVQDEALLSRFREAIGSVPQIRFLYFESGANDAVAITEWVNFFQRLGFGDGEVIFAAGQIRALLLSRGSDPPSPNDNSS